MPCYYPIDGWKSKVVGPNGKRTIVFNMRDGFSDMPIKIPCGKCIGCRLEHSKQWALRCMHESSLHKENMFLTLTYNNENLGEAATLNKKHFQNPANFLEFVQDPRNAKELVTLGLATKVTDIASMTQQDTVTEVKTQTKGVNTPKEEKASEEK